MSATIRKRLATYLGGGSGIPTGPAPSPEQAPLFAIRNRLPPRIGPHRHDFFEIELILEGEGWNSVGPIREAIGPGSIFLGNQFEDHAIECATPVTILSIKFAPDFLPRPGPLLDPLVAPDPAFRCHLPRLAPPVATRFREEAETVLAEYDTRQSLWTEAARSALTGLLVIIARAWETHRLAAGGLSSGSTNPLVLEILAYIDSHFRDPHGLDGLEARLGYSRSHLNRVFRTVSGQSLQEFVIARRLRHACQLLATTDWPVTEIALASGFNDISHFTRSFRLAHGLSPRQYRLKHGPETQSLHI